nr:VWA domain-containing protein [uncultured Methanoregula sp.]
MIHRIILIALGLFFMVSITAAADLSPSTMTSSNTGWLVANGNDQSTITVHVMQGSPASDISGANVAFSLAADSQDLGTLSAPSGTTGSDGIAQTIFRTTTKSGTATINVIITYNDGTTTALPLSCTQKIDHDIPWSADPGYQDNVPVGSITHLDITLRDANNNPVDNKNTAEIHTVHLYMSGDGGSGFVQGTNYVQDIQVPTDSKGNVSVDLRVSTLAGINSIQVYPVGSYLGDLITINGVSDSNPCYLTQVHPSPSSYPADGKDPDHKFTFYWTVLDKYGNPIENADLYVTSSKAGEEVHLITSTDGMVSTPYGPKDIAGVYTITARPVITGTTTARNATILCMDTGTSGFCSQTVEYTPMIPVDMILTASPQTMESMDVTGAKAVDVKARVVDASGNAVKGETVTFTKSADTYTGFTETAQSLLTPPTSVTTTAETGYAIVQFVPGTFAKKGETGYNEAATGSCIVTARWTNPTTGEIKSREITFVWKNYPFLSVDSAVDNPDPKVGDIINVKVWVRGTGAALQPKPIDVVLVMDRSGSMLNNYPGRPDDAMVEAKAAALTFSTKLTQDKDHIGILSFGDNDATSGWAKLAPIKSGSWSWTNVYSGWSWVAGDSSTECGSGCPNGYSLTSTHNQYLIAHYNNGNPMNYGDNVYTHQDLSLDSHTQTAVDTALTSIVPAGGTPMREGLTAAVGMFPAYSAERPIRAIILLTDGQYTTGDPESNPSVITSATNNKIKIFTIGLGKNVNVDDLKSYATKTGGNWYPASDPSQLANIYSDIAGKLNEQAGGQTQMFTDFSVITVDGNAVTGSQNVGKYIQYVPDLNLADGESSSTYVSKTSTQTPIDYTKNDYYAKVRDDTGNFTTPTLLPGLTPGKLQFDVGKIILNDVWMTNIKFKMLQGGQIGIFGTSSPVTFIDAVTGKSQTVTIPARTWTIHTSKVDNPFAPPATLTVTGVKVEGSTTDPNLWTVTWNTDYDASSVVHEKLLYCSETGTDPVSCDTVHTAWRVYDTLPDSIYGTGVMKTTPGTLVVDTSTWKSGQTYKLTIWAETDDGKENSGAAFHPKDNGAKKAYIKLE